MTLQRATITKATGSWFDAETTDGGVIRCRMRGRMRLRGVRSTSPVVVGDEVECEQDAMGEWIIVAIAPRRNYIIRRASNLSKESHIIAANIDRALCVVTLAEPRTATEFIDRFTITCEAYKIPVTIVLTKADLLDIQSEEVAEFRRAYESAGYEVVETSTIDCRGIDRIRSLIDGQRVLLSGNSGVGKSSLVAMLDPTADVRTGAISESHHRGRHTTTFSTMYRVGNGQIIDTPGIKGFGLIDIEDSELWHYFPEMLATASGCRFYNCTHTHEPDCAVVEAVRTGRIAFSRYESYLKIMDDDDKYRK